MSAECSRCMFRAEEVVANALDLAWLRKHGSMDPIILSANRDTATVAVRALWSASMGAECPLQVGHGDARTRTRTRPRIRPRPNYGGPLL